ncbi:hypothetical protein [Candidatus Paracaedibacter symbiosus]|uniref:hypothetical protein n=1 Tax=Candidatus Paracaedibacter symbiosus TaxID=244582 RepID=UPI0005095552|nr:hypothetical protein [Candidatus Paracaedibacter symbiosus]
MKYLILSPSYSGSCIQDEFNGEIELEDLNLPKDFIEEINIWHFAYKKFIPLSKEQRNIYAHVMEALDNQGLEIASKLKTLIPGGAKIKYFSERKLSYLPC